MPLPFILPVATKALIKKVANKQDSNNRIERKDLETIVDKLKDSTDMQLAPQKSELLKQLTMLLRFPENTTEKPERLNFVTGQVVTLTPEAAALKSPEGKRVYPYTTGVVFLVLNDHLAVIPDGEERPQPFSFDIWK